MRNIAIFLVLASVLAILSGCTPSVPSLDETVPAGITEPTEAIITTPVEAESTAPTEESSDEGAIDLMQLFETYLGDYLDSSHYHTSGQDGVALNQEYRVYKYNDLPLDGYILIGTHTKVALEKTTLNDLLLQGWELRFELTEDSRLGAHMTASGYYLSHDGYEIRVGLLNDTDEAIHLTDTKIDYLVLTQYNYQRDPNNRAASAAPFSVDGKLNQNSDIQSIIAAYGEPTSISFAFKDNYAYLKLGYNALSFYMSTDGTTLYKLDWY